MSHQPTAIGTQADIQSGVKISQVHGGYFSRKDNLKMFCEISLNDIWRNLFPSIKYADFGAGEGDLASFVANYLKEKGVSVNSIAVDGNENYLQIAKKKGLETALCNLENCQLDGLNLITMRAVNHYNPIDKQIEILRSAFNSLNKEGYLISQVSSGSEANCRLRSDIVNIPELGRAGSGNYHWTSIEEYSKLLSKAGFVEVEYLGNAPSNSWGPEEQWERFNKKSQDMAKINGDKQLEKNLSKRREEYLNKTSNLLKSYLDKYSLEELGVSKTSDSFIITYLYPIIRARK